MVEKDNFMYKNYNVIYTIFKKEITNITIINTLDNTVILNSDCNITVYKDNFCNIGNIIRRWIDDLA